MNYNKYILEKYNGPGSRYHCPSCGKNHEFTRYINTDSGLHIHPDVGRCNREANCGYHFTPRQYFVMNPNDRTPAIHIRVPHKIASQPSYHHFDLFKHSVCDYNQNNLLRYLLTFFDIETVNEILCRYPIGTSQHWPNSIVFWQMDIYGRLCAGKIMQYDPLTGKRVKEPFNHITWVHRTLKIKGFILKQCFFGEHLLALEPSKTVAIVESEKTAIIASVYLPQFVWLAIGSLTNLSAERFSILKGRKVILVPDLGGFEKWDQKANELKHTTPSIVSDLLELCATNQERLEGLDLADYLIRFNHRIFRKEEREKDPVETFNLTVNTSFENLENNEGIEENYFSEPASVRIEKLEYNKISADLLNLTQSTFKYAVDEGE